MTDWFRSWHGAPTDPKWLGIAKRAGVAPGVAVAVAWALMDRASQAEDRGCIEGYDADGLACFFGCEPEQVDGIVDAMTDKGMLAGGRFAAWEKRQPKREDNSTERVREHRKRNVTHGNAPDTDTDTDPEKRKNTPPPQASGGAGSYSDDFEKVWAAYRPIAAKNATKADAARAHERLNKADREACLIGVQRYAAWLVGERQKRPETPAKHLATFIHKRGWEPFIEAEAAASGKPTTWLAEDDPRWPKVCDRYQAEHGKMPPLDKNRGWRFPSDYPELSPPTP